MSAPPQKTKSVSRQPRVFRQLSVSEQSRTTPTESATIPTAVESSPVKKVYDAPNAASALPSNDVTSAHPQIFDLQLLANFIHQIVNPLNGVAGILDNLAEGKVKGPGRAVQRLNSARAQLEQCISLVRNLAFFAQGFSKLKSNERRLVKVPQVIIEAAQVYQEQAANKKMTIDLIEKRDENVINGHPELIRQIFVNLFDNAVKYGAPSTRVEIHQRIQAKTGDVLITVSNVSNGPIDKQDIAKIFDLGFRGGNAKRIIASGTGLGLYICKKIVEDVHSGRMWAELSGDGRVTFFISLPKVA